MTQRTSTPMEPNFSRIGSPINEAGPMIMGAVARRLGALLLAVVIWSHLIVSVGQTDRFWRSVARCPPLSDAARISGTLDAVKAGSLLVVGGNGFIQRISSLMPKEQSVATLTLPPLQPRALAMVLDWQAYSGQVVVIENQPAYWSNLTTEGFDVADLFTWRRSTNWLPIEHAASILTASLSQIACATRPAPLELSGRLLPSDHPTWINELQPSDRKNAVLWIGDVAGDAASSRSNLGRFISSAVSDATLFAAISSLSSSK